MKNLARTFWTELSSEPMIREALHKRMSKLETKLSRLASLYFGEKITIIYSKGTLKIDKRDAEEG